MDPPTPPVFFTSRLLIKLERFVLTCAHSRERKTSMPPASFMVQRFIMYCKRVVENDINGTSSPFYAAHELAIDARVQRNTWDSQLEN